jgi:2-(1,2-epoxy-1,2-dihydrophenyl)acetyl-CoA isomerase
MNNFDTGTDDLLATVSGGVATITLNRPDRRNAMSAAMLEGLSAVLAAAEASDLVGAVMLTGAGSAFCAGGDVKGFSERGGEGGTSAEVDPERVAAQRLRQRDARARPGPHADRFPVRLPGRRRVRLPARVLASVTLSSL